MNEQFNQNVGLCTLDWALEVQLDARATVGLIGHLIQKVASYSKKNIVNTWSHVYKNLKQTLKHVYGYLR